MDHKEIVGTCRDAQKMFVIVEGLVSKLEKMEEALNDLCNDILTVSFKNDTLNMMINECYEKLERVINKETEEEEIEERFFNQTEALEYPSSCESD